MSKHIHLDDTSDLRVIHGMISHNFVERHECGVCQEVERTFVQLMQSGKLDAILGELGLLDDLLLSPSGKALP